MGVIEDGTISGRLPSAEVFAVHYPGYPSISRAIETLGGIDGITKARNSNSDKLELHFRPEDPCSHPICGQLCPCNNFLLKISRKPRFGGHTSDSVGHHNSGEDQISDCKDDDLTADIVARVGEQYLFNGMADYQHVIPVHADVARKRKRSLVELASFDEMGTPADENENLMILLPPLFSPKDVPENLVLKPSAMISSKKKLEGVVQHRWEMKIEPCLAIDFNIKAKKVHWEEHIPQGSDQWKSQMAVSKLFDERPIWPKTSICERLATLGYNFRETALKRFLFRVAYYFGSGPFHRLWIRKGYDPRQDPESRIYQLLDFRLPPHLKVNNDSSDGSNSKWEDICSFRVFPSKYITYLQLCELKDDYIQQEIQKPPKQTICTAVAGWFSPHTFYSLRLRIAVRFVSVYPQAGAESMLKSLSERFEKLKRMQYIKNIKPNTENESGADEEHALDNEGNEDHNVEKEMDYGDKDAEDAEVEDEDEEIDEDPYAYDMGLGGDFSLEADSYQGGENASKDFLQGLFGGFSSTLGDNTHVSESDEEYQIYEQQDDGSDSNEEYL